MTIDLSSREPLRQRRTHLRRLASLALALAASGILPGLTTSAAAQDSWNPFADLAGIDAGARPSRPAPAPQQGAPVSGSPYLTPMDRGPGGSNDFFGSPARPDSRPDKGTPPGTYGQSPPADAPIGPLGPREKVESADLAPIAGPPRPIAGNTERGGFDVNALSELVKGLPIPSHSPTLTELLRHLFAAADGPLSGGGPEHAALKSMVLYRAGLIKDALAVAVGTGARAGAQVPLHSALVARLALAAGDRDAACKAAREVSQSRADLPAGVAGEMLVVQGYCDLAEGNAGGAGLAAGLAREQGHAPPELLAALDAVAVGEPAPLHRVKHLTAPLWRLAEIGKAQPRSLPLERAEPAALAAIATSDRADPISKLHAAELAARITAIDAGQLAAVYRQQQIPAESPARGDAALRRALLFRAAESERTPSKQTRHIRAALDEARRSGLYLQIATALAPAVAQLRPAPEIGWFTETAIEVLICGSRFQEARAWVGFGRSDTGRSFGGPGGVGPLDHWLALIDIADPSAGAQRGEGLAAMEELALRGRVEPAALHRLATVLDALDYNVPHRLWEASSRTPQPTAGYLPPTGVLQQLALAVKSRDQVRAILLTIHTLGPNGGEQAQIIALGDAIRAMKRSGHEAEARRLGFEALLMVWPRTSNS
ncbi:MAG: hypothetical protein AB7O43_03050 [Hyphomicrobiaceae bacterium]